MDDFYKILGVSKDATDADIKSAYRKLAHKYHPDKSGGDEKMFKKINEAYQVLSNRDKRSQYDRFGKAFDGTGGAPGGAGFDWSGFSGKAGPGSAWEFGFDMGGMEGENLGDVFDAFFEGIGVKRKRRAYERGSDLELIHEVTLEEVFHGATKKIKFKTFITCGTCSGLGHFPKDGFTECTACDGRGEIQESRRSFFGNFAQVKTCVKCLGLGKIPNKICAKCSGMGRMNSDREIEIAIAPGVSDGQLIKVPGAGESGPRGAAAGDLYLRIRVKQHTLFRREGDDLIVRHEEQLADLLLHRKISVKTISGNVASVEIPSGYRFGDRLTVSGEGMPRLGGIGKGKLVVELDVKAPKKISDRAKKLLEELKDEFKD